MPLTSKGEEILASMQKEYGEKKGEAAFYASKNSGKITGVDARSDDTLPEHEKGDDKRFAKIEAHLAKLEQAAGILTDLSKDGQRLRQRIDALTAWS